MQFGLDRKGLASNHSCSHWIPNVTNGGNLSIVQADAFLVIQLPQFVYTRYIRRAGRPDNARFASRYALWTALLEKSRETAAAGKI